MILKNLKLSRDYNGPWVVSIEITNELDTRALQKLTEVDLLDVTIKKHRNKRTLTQNAYLWILCDKLAKVLHSNKIDVYRYGIRSVGIFTDKDIEDADVEFFVKAWITKGEGYICDRMITKPKNGYTTIRFHKGSSKYNTEEMARLIDYIVEECKEQGIETMTREEIGGLK